MWMPCEQLYTITDGSHGPAGRVLVLPQQKTMKP